ncbi:MAG: aspartate/glutamate racemase family protein [Proteobacteria bacterium]|nr:aspartate/glutamate racemase family protein [Pseudomonadota bacterium]MBS0550721.1 aspartate/glutamate racemase family protein [Pseudomonadota bacterium]
MACVGIVGGLGVGATVHYYEKIATACKARGFVPDLVFNHADANTGQVFVREGRLDRLGDYLAPYIDQLGKAGAEAVAIPAVTPHIAIAEITARTKVPLINIMETLAAELRAKKVKRVALFGTIYTMQGSLWGRMTAAEIVKARPDEMTFIGEAYQRLLDTQAAAPGDVERLREIAAALQKRDGVETILLAGTDLTVIFDEANAGFPCIDVARPHIDAIVARLAA